MAISLLALMILSGIIEFIENYGLVTLLIFSILTNVFLVYYWIRREKYFQLKQFELTLPPKFVFELNQDQRYQFLINENLAVKTENEILKKSNKRSVFVMLLILFIAYVAVFLIVFSEKLKQTIHFIYNKFKSSPT